MKAKKCKTQNCYCFTDRLSGLCLKCDIREKSKLKQIETIKRKENLKKGMYQEIREKANRVWGDIYNKPFKNY